MAKGGETTVQVPQTRTVVAVEQGSVTVEHTPQGVVVTESPVHTATTVEVAARVTLHERETFVLAMGQQGPPGRNGVGGGSDVRLFIVDMSPAAGGIVGTKLYVPDTVPANVLLTDATGDTDNLRVSIWAEGGTPYSPTVFVDGVPVVLSEHPTDRRFFTGYADIAITAPGDVTLTATSPQASVPATAVYHRAGAGPSVLSLTWGAYPGTQTELKAGDVIGFTGTCDPEAVGVAIQAGGACGGYVYVPASGGTFSGSMTISGASGAQTATVSAHNLLGTWGADFITSPLTLNQTYPSISAPTITYPPTRQALRNGEAATLAFTVTNSDSTVYTSPNGQLAITAAGTIGTAQVAAYNISLANWQATATRNANAATTTRTAVVYLAGVAPTCAISVAGAARLATSPTGINYGVTISPDQALIAAPTLAATIGSLLAGAGYSRTLRLTDADPRGTGVFTVGTMTNLAGLTGTTITSGSTYEVGSFAARIVTFPAFSQKVAIGASVGQVAKVSANIVDGNTLTFYPDTAFHSNGFSIVNAAGVYSPNGNYLWLSDAAFAGANTSGTLQASVGEAV